MISPFDSAFAEEFLTAMAKAEDAASLLEQTLHEFDETIMEDEPAKPVAESLSVRTWLGCCLLDACQTGFDYTEQAEPSGMADAYRLALQALREALARKKGILFFQKPLHDPKALVWNAQECMMLFNDEESEFVKKYAQSDENWAELFEATGDLYERLNKLYDSMP